MASVICGTTVGIIGRINTLSSQKDRKRNYDPLNRDLNSYNPLFNSLVLTLNGFAQVFASALLLNDQLVNLARGYVIIPMQSDIQKSFIVSQIEIHLSAIIQNVNLT